MQQTLQTIKYLALTNLYGFANNICTLEEKDILNFQKLEQNVRILTGSDIEEFKYNATHSDAPDEAKTKAVALSTALSNYLSAYEQSLVPDECNGVMLQNMYNKELSILNSRQRTTTKKGGLFSNCCGQGGNIDDNDEITYLEGEKVLSYTSRLNTTKVNNNGLYPKM